jgi:dephospho-CoA kinase
MTLNIGLTGGIGSGKTTVARIFAVLGVPVYSADDAAKRLMNEDEQLKQAIITEFGESSYSNHQLNRAFLAEQVFNDKEKLKKLNALTHPVTIRDSQQWMNQQTGPYAIKEAALIIETRLDQDLDYVICVTAPEELRIKRTLERGSISRDEVIRRMNNQLPESEKMKSCDFTINNDEEQALIPQVLDLHKMLLDLSENKAQRK